jgi:hypothetical protein
VKAEKKEVRIIIAIMSVLLIILPCLCGCSHPFPYQGSLTGNWSGQMIILARTIPAGGAISITIDTKGVCSGTVTTSGGGTAPISAQVDSNGNLTGTVSFTLNSTTFNSNWQGKITASGDSMGVQGTWTSQHGSGTFSGTGASSK